MAHRGASGSAPENTFAAFDLAIELGAEAIELDVQCCGSGEPVVVHDRVLTRLAGVPVDVSHASLSELQSLDVGAWFDPTYAGESIPTLCDVLVRYRHKVKLNIEIKSHHWLDQKTAAAVLAAMSEEAVDQVMVSSFNPVILRYFYRHRGPWCRGLIIASDTSFWHRRGWLVKWAGAQAVHCDAALVPWMKRHHPTCALAVWTIDDPVQR